SFSLYPSTPWHVVQTPDYYRHSGRLAIGNPEKQYPDSDADKVSSSSSGSLSHNLLPYPHPHATVNYRISFLANWTFLRLSYRSGRQTPLSPLLNSHFPESTIYPGKSAHPVNVWSVLPAYLRFAFCYFLAPRRMRYILLLHFACGKQNITGDLHRHFLPTGL